jgi:hypothetical protein
VTSYPKHYARHEPLYDIDPQTGASIEVFYADRALETFGKCGAGWFWWSRRRGFPPEGQPTGPFATSYAAYRHSMNTAAPLILGEAQPPCWLTYNANADTVRTGQFLEKRDVS